jgi:hypothetical protein
VALLNDHLDDLDSHRAKAYMTCRAVQAAKLDFDATDERPQLRPERGQTPAADSSSASKPAWAWTEPVPVTSNVRRRSSIVVAQLSKKQCISLNSIHHAVFVSDPS